jgi:hypothetical protein
MLSFARNWFAIGFIKYNGNGNGTMFAEWKRIFFGGSENGNGIMFSGGTCA